MLIDGRSSGSTYIAPLRCVSLCSGPNWLSVRTFAKSRHINCYRSLGSPLDWVAGDRAKKGRCGLDVLRTKWWQGGECADHCGEVVVRGA